MRQNKTESPVLTVEAESEQQDKNMEFKDLEFKPTTVVRFDPMTGKPQTQEVEAALVMFDNGYGIKVTKEDDVKMQYGISVLNDHGEPTCATEITSCRIRYYDNPEEISAVMKKIQHLDEDGCIQGREVDQMSERGKQLKIIGACKRGDVNTVKNIINGGVNVNINVNLVLNGEDYLRDSLFDLVEKNPELLGLLIKDGLDLKKLMERNENNKQNIDDKELQQKAQKRGAKLEKISKKLNAIMQKAGKKIGKGLVQAAEIAGVVLEAGKELVTGAVTGAAQEGERLIQRTREKIHASQRPQNVNPPLLPENTNNTVSPILLSDGKDNQY